MIKDSNNKQTDFSCGYCADNAACDVSTGKCPAGCAKGYSGQLCDQPQCDGKIGFYFEKILVKFTSFVSEKSNGINYGT